MKRVPGGSGEGSGLPRAGYWFAGVALAAYLVAVLVLWGQVDADDLRWARRLYLLGGLEAIAFAATGAVFGATVQRQSTKREVEGREKAEQQVSELSPKAQLGDALRAAVEAKVQTGGGGGRSRRFGDADAAASGGAPPDLEELEAMIQRYEAGGRSTS